MDRLDPYRLPHITRADAEAVMRVAGIEWTWCEEVVNRYWPVAYSPLPPWFLFMTAFGPVIIGHRKRVIQIDWHHTNVRAIVTSDDTTKEDAYVHAWTLMKAAEYLKALKAAAGATQPERDGRGNGR